MSASERFRVSLVGRLAPKRFSPNRRRRKHALFSVWVRKLGRALKPVVLRRDRVYAPYAVHSRAWGLTVALGLLVCGAVLLVHVFKAGIECNLENSACAGATTEYRASSDTERSWALN